MNILLPAELLEPLHGLGVAQYHQAKQRACGLHRCLLDRWSIGEREPLSFHIDANLVVRIARVPRDLGFDSA